MILSYIKEKIKDWALRAEETPIFITLIIIMVAFASFGLGRLSLIDEKRAPVKIIVPKEAGGTGSASAALSMPQTSVVASKNGAKYYFSWCSGISRISEANKVTFPSAKEAEKAGYTIAANCTAP